MPRSRRAMKKSVIEYEPIYDIVFRGYGDSDKISRKKEEDLRSFESVCKSDDLFGVFREGIVMVDVDEGDSANKIQRILDDSGVSYLYQKTSRGLHFFFDHGRWSRVLRDKSHILSAIGVEVDYKCYSVDGTKLSKTLEDGSIQPRPLLKSANWRSLQEIPSFLLPVNALEDFASLKECRNESFFTYILKLMRFGFSKEETRETIRIINNYVLKSPLSKREIDTILRDESFPSANEIYIYKQAANQAPKLDYELFARHLIEKHHIIKIDSRPYVYDSGVYVFLDSEKLNQLVMDELKNTTKNMRGELKEYIINFSPIKEQTSYNFILFRNCIYDVINDAILPLSPDMIFLNKIDHDYDPDAEPVEVVDQVFRNLSCNDDQVQTLLKEIIGFTFYRRNKMRKFFVLVGNGFNGKSTYLDMIERLLSSQNVARVTLQEITNDKFATQMLSDKLVDLGDDIEKEFVQNTGILKKLVTGESIIAQKKGQDQFNLTYYGKLIFSCNEIPRISDKTEGMKSRMVVVPLLADFRKTGKIPFVDEKLKEEKAMKYILKMSMDALKNLLREGEFIIPEAVKNATSQYNTDNDSVQQWLEEFGEINQRSIKETYFSYCIFCQEGNMKPEGRTLFCRRFYNQGYERKSVKDANQKTKYIFSKIEGVDQLG